MPKNVVVSRLKPQLVRKRAAVKLPTTVKVVIQPSQNRSAKLQQISRVKQIRAKAAAAPKAAAVYPRVKPPSNQAVSQKRKLRRNLRRRKQVKYITANVSADSIAKINTIRRKGVGKLLVIVGNGPSINECDLQKLRNVDKIDTMSINKPDERLWPTTYWCFFDGSQMKRHENLWTNYSGNIFNSIAIKKQKSTSMQIKNLHGKGFSRDLAKGLYIGRSSVYAAMQIALWLSYEHVYIFGCDMNPDGLNGKLHFYGDNPDVEPQIRKNRFKDEAAHYDNAATILSPEERKRYTFCTEYNPWSFVKEFQQMSHKTVIDHILGHAEQL